MKKNILIFSYNLKLGGSELNALKLSESIDHNFYWLSLLDSGHNSLGGNKIKSFSKLSYNRSNFIINLFKIRKILIKKNVHIIYAIGYLPGFLSSILKIFFNFKLIVTRRGEDALSKKIKLYLINLFTFFFCDLIETNSKFIYLNLKKDYFFKNKIILVKNIIPHYIINIKKKKFNSKKINLGVVANLRPVKNPFFTYSLIKLLLNSESKYKFFVVGRDYLNLYENLSKKYKKNFFWLKEKHNKSMRNFYKKIDLMLITSKFESFPNTVLESFSNSIPVVSVPFPGSQYIVKHGFNGLLLKKFSKEEFINKLNQATKKVNLLSTGAKLTFYKKYDQVENLNKIKKYLLS
jgi:glycosyltransferase involved in cell wall biosynthesis